MFDNMVLMVQGRKEKMKKRGVLGDEQGVRVKDYREGVSGSIS